MSIGESLREQRVSKNLSLMDIEKATGIGNGSLCRWEKDQVIPSVSFCIQLAQFYGCTLDELVGLSDNPISSSPTTLPANKPTELAFVKEYADIISDNNFINVAKLYKAITPELRALALGYIVGLLQNQNVNTQKILGY